MKAAWGLVLAGAAAAQTELPLDWQAVLNRVRAASLEAHVSFLASDLLEGRDTPSRGQDIAAEYAASIFRRAGLKPAGTNGFLHESVWRNVEPLRTGASLKLSLGSRVVDVPPAGITVRGGAAVKLQNLPAVVWKEGDPATDLAGKVVIADGAKPAALRLVNAGAQCLILLNPSPAVERSLDRLRLRPKQPAAPETAVVSALSQSAMEILTSPSVRLASLDAPEPRGTDFVLRNTTAILEGSDARLRGEYILVAGHHDHVGMATAGEDRVFNGANDDASGTSAVLELAAAIAAMPQAPARSILFMTIGGEEKGGLGSRAFVANPTVPLASIVAMVNLEVLGRTDMDGATRRGRATITGFHFSTLPAMLAEGARRAGLALEHDETNGDAFFSRSDNVMFARAGIPAHTISNGFLYPDYHKPGDHWDKLDYANLEAIVRGAAAGILTVANTHAKPAWDANRAEVQTYRRAR